MLEIIDGKVRMDGEIGDYFENGIAARDVAEMLQNAGGDDLTITLKSDGGDVFEGLSIYNQISQYSGRVVIEVDAIAASIASVIAMAADELAIHGKSMLMIHNPMTAAAGDAAVFRGVADILDVVAEQIAGVYSDRSGKPVADFLEMMKSDRYITDVEAVEMGLADRIIESGRKSTESRKSLAACASFPSMMRAKMRLKTKLS